MHRNEITGINSVLNKVKSKYENDSLHARNAASQEKLLVDVDAKLALGR